MHMRHGEKQRDSHKGNEIAEVIQIEEKETKTRLREIHREQIKKDTVSKDRKTEQRQK